MLLLKLAVMQVLRKKFAISVFYLLLLLLLLWQRWRRWQQRQRRRLLPRLRADSATIERKLGLV
jgi:hypothetical protein